jgi:hypothetical protein
MGTFQTKTQLENTWGHFDPFDWERNLLTSLGGGKFSTRTAITFESATQTLVTVPANSNILRTKIIRTTAWDAITTFTVGKTGTLDWLATTVQANVTAAITGGEEGDAEVVENNKVVTTATPVILTLNQGAASAGAGYVVIEYQELT